MNFSGFLKSAIGVAIIVGAGYWLWDGGWADLTRAPGVEGVTLYTASRSPKLEEELFVSTGIKREAQADAEALARCQASTDGIPGLACRKITFMKRHTCMVRYRIGNGLYSVERPSLESADIAAKFNCEASQSRSNSKSACIKDAEICTEGNVRKLRPWGRAALGVTQPYQTNGSQGAVMNVNILGGKQASEAAGKKALEKGCRELTGKPCLAATAFSGDVCIALSASTSGIYSFFGSQNEFAAKLKAVARCSSQSKAKCSTVWICASSLVWN